MPTHHYRYVYEYIKSTVVEEKPKYNDDDSSRRRRKRHSSTSARMEESESRSNESLRPLWVAVNKIDNDFGLNHACSVCPPVVSSLKTY